ncbi:PA14 domain-containing protein [Luteolibacter sp. SL250]|uniref:PA14 domain-containing protein n=1 Tax=Luteolibacter sp. SL250 TaxID=2995170 RepID=UPI00226E31E1|nr:PA14 domain-containing protein [Luteolibacter sp. SL250]WAC20799.1 PA14 domain-containing protein [Luteolibacter sp. SL250]
MMKRATAVFMALLCGGAAAAEQAGSVFGSAEKSAGAMIGIFYDLKQNQRRQPVKVNYLQTLGEFLDSGWDENVLSRFFRGTKPVYATDVFIPTMSAGAAPEAFDLKDVVQPMSWFVIYKAQVSPPEDGTYRFVGASDDVMAVGVNGRTVLVSHYMGTANTSKWRQQDPKENTKAWAGELRRGDWFEAKKDQPIDLDILIGEYPGNIFAAWLLIEKKGATYPMVDDRYGRQIALPVFQVKPRQITPKENDPPFTTDGVPWTCHQ